MTNSKNTNPAMPDRPSRDLPVDDRNSDPAFVAYYEERSVSEGAEDRFRSVRDKMLRLHRELGGGTAALDVLNVGCGAGTECQIWAELGHRVAGIDISEPLVELARKRALSKGFGIHFDVGSAVELPYSGNSFDICLVPQLLEHVPDWQKCLDEAVRVLRPGGILYLTTTNALCPVQNEFTLPLYSWYPGFVKRHCERLAVTTHRDWVSHTAYPAVHWFTYWKLKRFLSAKGMRCFDRFDLAQTDATSGFRRIAFRLIKQLPPLRAAAYLLVAGTIVAGAKPQRASVSP
jgi:2-polyprenyl-3-methyl-5-hydroxy-6-metoxy-1,4-benzoquinol methylase